MPEIRLVEDEELLKEAFGWQDNAPDWFKQSQATEDETLDDFLETAKDKLFYGIFDNEFTALIRLNPFSQKVFSIDLFAKRKTDWSVLAEAALSLKHYLYDNDVCHGFFGWIPDKNRGIVRLYKFLGFSHNGIVCYKGQYHGKVVRWLLMASKRENN
jgi:hypothetical protein